MRTFLLLIGIYFFIISCNNKLDKNSDKDAIILQKSIPEFINENLSKNSKNDTIFLDFVLGDSKINTEKHFYSLYG